MRPDGEGLEDHAEAAVFGRNVKVLRLRGYQFAADLDLSLVKVLEARDHAQRRSLAAAGGAEE
ncbi:hypothetical protein SDC9_163977 [bioreactor metagenome]|uniref:Uncharacterized protein n=1 Tax=bioreactor metagenome TaxID=1076179 RepID=A0A645FSM5_9ZZZZ